MHVRLAHAVRVDALPARDARSPRRDGGREVVDQRALADAGLAGDEDDLGASRPMSASPVASTDASDWVRSGAAAALAPLDAGSGASVPIQW